MRGTRHLAPACRSTSPTWRSAGPRWVRCRAWRGRVPPCRLRRQQHRPVASTLPLLARCSTRSTTRGWLATLRRRRLLRRRSARGRSARWVGGMCFWHCAAHSIRGLVGSDLNRPGLLGGRAGPAICAACEPRREAAVFWGRGGTQVVGFTRLGKGVQAMLGLHATHGARSGRQPPP